MSKFVKIKTVPCPDAAYIVEDSLGVVIETGTIPSGGSKTITVPPGGDATWTLLDEDGNTLDTGTILAGGSAVIEAPNADYVITDEDSNVLYNGTILSGGSLSQQISNSTFETKQSDGTIIHTDSILAEGNGSRNIADSVITLEDTNSNTISTTNVKATDSATIEAPDGTVNIAGGQIEVLSGGSETITHEDTNGDPVSTSLSGTVVTVLGLPDTELGIAIPFQEDDTTVSVDAVAYSEGTVTSILSGGLTNLDIFINGNPVTTPFSIATGDLITLAFDQAVADGVVTLIGNHA